MKPKLPRLDVMPALCNALGLSTDSTPIKQRAPAI